MRILLTSLAFLLVLTASPAHAQQAESKQAKIERILTITNSEKTVNQMLDQVTAMMSSQVKSQLANESPENVARAEAVQKKLMDLIKSHLSWEKMRPEYMKIYADLYSDEELDGMLAFYQSPAGQGFIRKMPLLTQKTMAIAQAQMVDLMPEIQQMAKEAAAGK